MFFLPFSAAENKTVYVRPGREEIIKRLEESKRLAGNGRKNIAVYKINVTAKGMM